MSGDEVTSDPGADTAGRGLELEGVSVRYGPTTVLDELDLRVAPGEVVAVVGPSGSGKSTLLRAVAGLEPLAAGRVRLDGRDLGPVPTHQRGLGLMFQDHGLFTHLDVAGNVGYGLEIGGRPPTERDRRVERLLGLVGLDGLSGRRVDQLSGGEAQRVALARALAPEPGLLMLDEPLGSLDRALREQLTVELRRLLGELGQTALHVTHDQGEAFTLADRVAVLDGGRLVAIDTPARLWADPGTSFVARFLGHTNLWTVTVDDGGSVRAGGVALGRVTGERGRVLGPGPVDAVLPATAVVPSTDGGVRARVTEVVFDRGRHRVEAVLGVGDDGGRPLPVEFESITAVAVDDEVALRLDLDQLRPLSPDRHRSR